MYHIKQAEWDNIPEDYKGTWQDYYNEHPEWIGRRVVMSGCVIKDPSKKGYLMVEGVHFAIEEESTTGAER